MRMHYCQDTDTLYIEFADCAVAESRDLGEDTLLELDEAGGVCAMTIEHASSRKDFRRFSIGEPGA